MQSVIFWGKVRPYDTVKVSLYATPYMIQPWPEGGGSITLVLNITASVIMVRCEVESYETEQQARIMYDLASNMANTAVAVLGFATGYGLTAWLESIAMPDEKPQPLIMSTPELAAECTAYKLDSDSEEDKQVVGSVVTMALTEPELHFALQDLNAVLTRQEQAPIACARVIDGLRKMVAPNLLPKQGWPILHALLNVDAAYIKYVSDYSANPRHGDRSVVPAKIVNEIARRTWIVMNRFLIYKRRIDGPLPLDEFPLLHG